MIAVSNELKNACNNSNTITYREYIILDNDEIDIKAKLFQTAYKNTHFIGKFNINYIEFTTDNEINYKNKEFDYYKEVNGEPIKIGHFITTSVQDNDTNELIKVTAFDNGIKFAQPYKTFLNYSSGRVTLFDVLQECCTLCDVELVNDSITNGDFIVDGNQFIGGEQFGDVISSITSISCDFGTINADGKLELIFTKDTNEIIENYVELLDKRDTRPITSVSIGVSNIDGENVVMKDQALIDQYGEHWLNINDVPFAYSQNKRQQLITAIFNKIKGFGYSSFTSKYAFKPYMQLGDKIKFRNKNGDLVESVILRIESDYDNITLSAPSIINATVDYQQPVEAIDLAKRAEILVDKANQTITSVVATIGDRSTKQTTITQDLDRIEASISDIADITEQKEGLYELEFESTSNSVPINLRIHATNNDISYIYPKTSLFPSNNLFVKNRTLRIRTGIGTVDEITYDYEIPVNLRYFNGTYDEFIIDEEEQRCYEIKKIGVNSDGSKYLLSTIETISLEMPVLELREGGTTFTLISYQDGWIYARVMSNNIYTNQFATKIELNSSITAEANRIDAIVSKRINYVNGRITKTNSSLSLKADSATLGSYYTKTESNNTFGTKAELQTKIGRDENNQIVSMLNASADVITLSGGSSINLNTAGKLIISAGNFKINSAGDITATNATITGNITATSGTIGGCAIENGVLKVGSANITSLNASSITTGTLSVDRIPNLNASKITAGTITGVSIRIGNYFKVSSTGIAELTTSAGYLTMGTTSHPYVSGINVGNSGIVLCTGIKQDSIGEKIASIFLDSYNDGQNRCLRINPGGRFYIDNKYGLTGKVRFVSDSGRPFHLAFHKGILSYAGWGEPPGYEWLIT